MPVAPPPDLEHRVLVMIKLHALIGLPNLVRELDLGHDGITKVREVVARLIDEGKIERVRSPCAGYRVRKSKVIV